MLFQMNDSSLFFSNCNFKADQKSFLELRGLEVPPWHAALRLQAVAAAANMLQFALSAYNLLCRCLGVAFAVWFTLLFVIIIVPAVLGVSLGIHGFYIRTLCRLFEVRVWNRMIQESYKKDICHIFINVTALSDSASLT